MSKRLAFLLVSLLSLYFYSFSNSLSPFGINVHLVENEVLDKVAEAGIGWIRIDVNWNHIEPERGQLYFDQVDRVVDFARDNSLSVLAIISYTPSWANGGKGLNHPADDVADWEGFVTTTVTRYRDRVKYWNIWNGKPKAA